MEEMEMKLIQWHKGKKLLYNMLRVRKVMACKKVFRKVKKWRSVKNRKKVGNAASM